MQAHGCLCARAQGGPIGSKIHAIGRISGDTMNRKKPAAPPPRRFSTEPSLFAVAESSD